METRLKSANQEVIIGPDRHTVIIGERLNPTGKKRLSQAYSEGDMEYIRREALAQVEAGAHVLDVNVGVAGLDQVKLMAQVVQAVVQAVDVPLSLDSNDPETLKAGLEAAPGRPLINSVNAEERSLEQILPLVKAYNAAVIALPMNERGIPGAARGRLELARKIMTRCSALGIPPEDVIFDGLAMTVAAQGEAGQVTLDTLRGLREEFGVNLTLGVSNVSFGLPDRGAVNKAFLAMSMAAGVNCPVVDAGQVRETILAADVALGRDQYAQRYLKAYRARQAR